MGWRHFSCTGFAADFHGAVDSFAPSFELSAVSVGFSSGRRPLAFCLRLGNNIFLHSSGGLSFDVLVVGFSFGVLTSFLLSVLEHELTLFLLLLLLFGLSSLLRVLRMGDSLVLFAVCDLRCFLGSSA